MYMHVYLINKDQIKKNLKAKLDNKQMSSLHLVSCTMVKNLCAVDLFNFA